MKIGIISAKPNGWRMREFTKAANRQRVRLVPVNPWQTRLELKNGEFSVSHPEVKINKLDSSIHGGNRYCFQYVLFLLSHMENMNIPLTAGSHAVWKTRNKFATMQELSKARIPVPNTYLTYSHDLALKGMDRDKKPVVLKLLESSSGKGIMKANDFNEVEGYIGTLKALDQMIFMQEYIENSGDIRAFIVGSEIVASMKRKGKKGMWKSNISRGGYARKIRLDSELEEMALKTAEVLETKICGVDIIESRDGYKILEANITPGFKGLVKYTGVNPAPKVIRLARDIVKN